MTDQPEPAHGCTINGQPAMPILVAEHQQLVARAAEAEAKAARARTERDTWQQHAETLTASRDRAQAGLARIRALADQHPVGIDTALIHEALNQTGPPPARELADILAAVLNTFPHDLNPDGPAVRSRHVPTALLNRWRTAVDQTGKPSPATAAHDSGPSIQECRDADRRWPLEKAGE